MPDVHLFEQDGQGEIDSEAGVVSLCADGGLETAVILSLFGGNPEDTGIQGDDKLQWWGNFSEPDPAKKYRSETGSLLRSLPAVPANLRRLEEAATRDLQWMLDGDIADAVVAQASIPAVNKLQLTIAIEIDNQIFKFVFQNPPAQQ